MILSQPDLRRAVRRGQIVFAPPLEENQWGEASVDLRLGYSFTRINPLATATFSVAAGLRDLARARIWETVELCRSNEFGQPKSIDLAPDDFVLAMTHESITVPPNLIALVEGRSTYARVGLSMHQTAPWIQPGWEGPIVLEIRNSGPLTIKLTPLVDRPCQLTFFELTSALPADITYGSKPSDVYSGQAHPIDQARGASKTAPSKRGSPAKKRSRSDGGRKTRR